MLEKGSQTPVASIWKSDSTPFIPNPISEHLRNCGTGEQSDLILQTLAGREGGEVGDRELLHIPETSADAGELPDVTPPSQPAPMSEVIKNLD